MFAGEKLPLLIPMKISKSATTVGFFAKLTGILLPKLYSVCMCSKYDTSRCYWSHTNICSARIAVTNRRPALINVVGMFIASTLIWL